MTDAVTRARELLDKATPGPWWLLNEYTEPWEEGDEWHVYGRVGNRIPRVVDNSEDQLTWSDAELIAAAPTLLAELADEVDRMRSALHLRDTTPKPPENAAWHWSLISNSDYTKVCADRESLRVTGNALEEVVAERDELQRRLDAVEAIHAPLVVRYGDAPDELACRACGTHYEYPVAWPCPTVKAARGEA